MRYHPSAPYLSVVDLAGNLDDVAEAVMNWLSRPDNTRWLLIYDNYDNPRVPSKHDPTTVNIRKFLPDAHQGLVIITTRSPQIRIGQTILVRKLTSVQESAEILSSMLGRVLLADSMYVMLVLVQD